MVMIANGDSMHPTIKNGDTYAIEIHDNYDYKINDIVVYQYGDSYICHRIINTIISRNGSIFYKTKGDNCDKADSWVVTKEMIIGTINLLG